MTHPIDSDADKVLAVVAGIALAASLLVWVAGQIAALVWNQTTLPTSPAESPVITWRLLTNPVQPAEAWPAPSAGLVPGPVAYYTTLAVLIAFITTGGTFAYRLNRRDNNGTSARWAKPRDLKPLTVRRPQPGRLTLGTVDRRLVATEAQHSVAVIGPAAASTTTTTPPAPHLARSWWSDSKASKCWPRWKRPRSSRSTTELAPLW